MPELLAPSLIEDAASRLAGVAIRTPLLDAPWLADACQSPEVRLKCENLQRAGSFKFRGAYTTISRLDASVRARGVVTHSSGNHAQAVSLAARLFGIPATVVMPTTAPALKIENVRKLGATIVFEGTTSLDIQMKANALAAEQGLAMVEPFDHLQTMSGQGTAGLEILDEWAEADAVLVPVGGGGLLGGIATCVKHRRPHCLVVGVEPEHADALTRSLAAGRIVTLEAAPTIADGLKPLRPSELTLEHARAYVDQMVRVTDADIMAATRHLFTNAKLVVEFSGAAAVAALLSGRWSPAGRRVAVLLSGGNMDPATASRMLVETT